MPGGDRTGPVGAGPTTGRALGLCAGYPVPGYMNPAPGRGWGFGRGWGRGRGRGWRSGFGGVGQWAWGPPNWYGPYAAPPEYVPPTSEQEVRSLKVHAENLENTLEEIKRRIAELEAAREKEG